MVMVIGCLTQTGCVTNTLTTATIRNTPIKAPTLVPMPLTADIEVSKERVKHIMKFDSSELMSQASMKQKIKGELLFQSGGDLLLEPRFIITRKATAQDLDIDVTVDAFVGKYKNFRMATLEDIKSGNHLASLPVSPAVKAPLPAEPQQKKPSVGAVVGATFLSLILVGGLVGLIAVASE